MERSSPLKAVAAIHYFWEYPHSYLLFVCANIVLVHFSAKVTETLRQDERVAAILQRAMGTMFVVLGLRIAAEKV